MMCFFYFVGISICLQTVAVAIANLVAMNKKPRDSIFLITTKNAVLFLGGLLVNFLYWIELKIATSRQQLKYQCDKSCNRI